MESCIGVPELPRERVYRTFRIPESDLRRVHRKPELRSGLGYPYGQRYLSTGFDA